MSFENLINELKGNGFKVINRGESIRIIKNNKALTYNESTWNNLNETSKRIELLALYKAFN